MAPMSRREFLLAGAGLALAAACGGGDDGDPTAEGTGTGTGVGEGAQEKKPFNLVVASFVHVAGIDQRVTVALLNSEQTGPVRLDTQVSLTIDGQPVDSERHDDGTPLPYLLVRHRFEQPGIVMVGATYQGASGEAPLQVQDPAKTKVPFPGTAMVQAPSPTSADPLGVDPICTRVPACPLHDVSLDVALGEQRPLAVLFSTPARCQSRICGPVLDTLLEQRDAFADRVRFLHVEIFAARTGQALSPTVKAYNLEAEPVLFLAGADGMVRERLDNAFDRREAQAALERLTAQ